MSESPNDKLSTEPGQAHLNSGEAVVLQGHEPKSGFLETVGAPLPTSGEPIDLSLKNADLIETLRYLAKLSGVNLIVQPGLGGSVSIELNKMPLDRAMETTLRASGLRSQRDGNDVWVMRAFSPLSGAAFSPDGTRVVTTYWDGSARVWNVDGSGEPLVLGDQGVEVLSAAFSPDGTQIVTASADHSVRVWSIDWKDLIERLRPVTDACLTATQRIRYLGESPSEARAADESCRRERGLVSH